MDSLLIWPGPSLNWPVGWKERGGRGSSRRPEPLMRTKIPVNAAYLYIFILSTCTCQQKLKLAWTYVLCFWLWIPLSHWRTTLVEISSEGQWPFSRDPMQSNCSFSTVAANGGILLYWLTALHIAPTFGQSTVQNLAALLIYKETSEIHWCPAA